MKRKYLPLTALFIALAFVCSACAAKNSESDASAANTSSRQPAYAAPAEMAVAQEMGFDMAAGGADQAPASEAKEGALSAPGDASIRKIIYNANMDMTDDDPAKTMEALIAKAEALGGYVANSNISNDDDGPAYCSVTIKVPAVKLDELVAAARESAGKVNDYQLFSDDITLSYYDIEARLNNAKAEEQQLLAILEQCTSVEEILEVRNSLTAVRSDIESYQAQINLWDNLVGYATLELFIRRTPKDVTSADSELLAIWKASDVWANMQRGFQNSARFMVNALAAIGIFLAVAIIPAGILILCIGLPIILHKKKKGKLSKNKGSSTKKDVAAKDVIIKDADCPTALTGLEAKDATPAAPAESADTDEPASSD